MDRTRYFSRSIEELPMFQVDLAFLVTAAAVEAEVEGQDFRQLDLLRFEGPLHGEELSPGA